MKNGLLAFIAFLAVTSLFVCGPRISAMSAVDLAAAEARVFAGDAGAAGDVEYFCLLIRRHCDAIRCEVSGVEFNHSVLPEKPGIAPSTGRSAVVPAAIFVTRSTSAGTIEGSLKTTSINANESMRGGRVSGVLFPGV